MTEEIKKISVPFLLFIFWVIVNSCSTLHKVQFEEKNPTEFVFNFPVEKVVEVSRIQLKRTIERPEYMFPHNKFILLNDTTENILVIKNKLKQFDEHYDIYLDCSDGFYRGSQVYYTDRSGQKLGSLFYVSFHIHFKELDQNKTLVKINTIDPVIVEFIFNPLVVLFDIHGGVTLENKKVTPSTIEEYEILLEIGKGLGVSDQMPPIKLPKETLR